jgi:hypothetical protein
VKAEERQRLAGELADAVLERYRPGRYPDARTFLTPHAGGPALLFGGRVNLPRALVYAVAQERSENGVDDRTVRMVVEMLLGRAVAAAEPDPYPSAMNGSEAGPREDTYEEVPVETGAELLDEVAAFVLRYCYFPDDSLADAIALWVAHTHVYRAFTTTPRLLVKAPTIACGKTRVLEVIESLVAAGELSIGVSGPYLFRTIEARPVTLLLDEYESLWRDDSDRGLDLRAIIDAGYRKGATVGRVVIEGNTQTPRRFGVYCPVALAGVGWVPESVASRALHVAMVRRGPGDSVEPFDRDDAWASAAPLARRLAAWAQRCQGELDRHPVLPEGVVDRPAELWRPLLSIAALAGGHWPDTGAAVAVRLVVAAADREEDLSTLLLAHIAAVFDRTDQDGQGHAAGVAVDRLFSGELVERLCGPEEWPWSSLRKGPLTVRGLAGRLRPFDIAPKDVRIGEVVKKGYTRAQFEETWARFARAPMIPRPQPLQALQALHARSAPTRDVADVADVAATSGVNGEERTSPADDGYGDEGPPEHELDEEGGL